jgi:hypothetical protein
MSKNRILFLFFLLAFALRMALGAGAYWFLPIIGYDGPTQKAGYQFYDAYRRDTQAWQLAKSDQPLTAAFSGEYATDQYGGLLWMSAFTYRYLTGGTHQPLAVTLLAALTGAAGTFFVFAAARRLLERWEEVVQEVTRQFRLLRYQERTWRKKLEWGEEIDIQEAVERTVALRCGLPPSEKLYMEKRRVTREVSALFLVDLSASTSSEVREGAHAGETVLQVLLASVAIMASALEQLGDRYAICGFSGYGRDRVEFLRLKSFDEPLDAGAWKRLGGLKPMKSTRMGPAVRHAHRLLDAEASSLKLLLLLSDGYPQDHDYGDDRADREYGQRATPHAAHQRHVLGRRSALAEAGRGLHEVRAGQLGERAADDLLLIAQHAGLEDHLHLGRAGGADHPADVVGDGRVVAGLQGADVDHHVDLAGSVTDRLAGLEGLGPGRHGSQREAHHRADPDRAARQQRAAAGHVGAVDADSGEVEPARLLAELLEILGGGVGLEQGVVDQARQIARHLAGARPGRHPGRARADDGAHVVGALARALATGRASVTSALEHLFGGRREQAR